MEQTDHHPDIDRRSIFEFGNVRACIGRVSNLEISATLEINILTLQLAIFYR